MRNIIRFAPALLAFIAATPVYADNVWSRVDVLERRMDVVTSLSLQVENLTQENNALRGEIDVLRHDLEELKKQQREMYLDIERRLGKRRSSDEAPVTKEPEPKLLETSVPAKTAIPQPTEVVAAPAQQHGEEASYRQAYVLLIDEKQIPDAIKAFQKHLQEFPSGPYADNAQFWLGEARYAGNDLDGAMKEFEKLVEFYTGSPKVPDALYKVGYIRELRGETDKARSVFEGLVQHYPDTSAAKLASEKLNRLAAN